MKNKNIVVAKGNERKSRVRGRELILQIKYKNRLQRKLSVCLKDFAHFDFQTTIGERFNELMIEVLFLSVLIMEQKIATFYQKIPQQNKLNLNKKQQPTTN